MYIHATTTDFASHTPLTLPTFCSFACFCCCHCCENFIVCVHNIYAYAESMSTTTTTVSNNNIFTFVQKESPIKYSNTLNASTPVITDNTYIRTHSHASTHIPM